MAFSALLLILLCSCSNSVSDDDGYLYYFNNEISKNVHQPDKIENLRKEELEKYKETGNHLYLISSKYSELFINSDEVKQIPKVYELLSLNHNHYNYITIACNFNLAYQFEKISPEQSMKFLDKAIETDIKTGKMYFLPHLYHLKGKLYFDGKDYDNAIFYFNKAIESYIKRGRKDDILYIASMYNNLGMTYEKINNNDKAIENTEKGINILKQKKLPTVEEKYHLQKFSGNLASYLSKKGNYPEAEKLLLEEWDFYKKNEAYYNDAITSSQRLLKIYSATGKKNKQNVLVHFLNDIEPKLSSVSYRITANEILQDYYSETNNLQNLKTISEKIMLLQDQNNAISEKKLQKVSDTLYKYILKKTDEEYNSKIASNKRKIWILSAFAILIISFSVWIIRNIKSRNKKEKELLGTQNIILENNKKLLEQEVLLHKEKIKNLSLNLNLKIETEKAFLENLKKIRKTKNTDVEQLLKDLQFKINNLIQIDRKNYDFINESSLENTVFMEKLSAQYPSLTDQELRLCVYFKLNLSSKEVSLLENITDGSVRVYKTKIKSKMGLGKEKGLNDFLKMI